MGFKQSKKRDRLYGTKEDHSNWKGGTISNGRAYINMPGHPRGLFNSNNYVSRALIVVETAMCEVLSGAHPIHHFDGDELNDSNDNLVVCENQGYHLFLQRRKRAYDACGYADWRKCMICGEYDNLNNLAPNSKGFLHKECRRIKNAEYRKQKK